MFATLHLGSGAVTGGSTAPAEPVRIPREARPRAVYRVRAGPLDCPDERVEMTLTVQSVRAGVATLDVEYQRTPKWATALRPGLRAQVDVTPDPEFHEFGDMEYVVKASDPQVADHVKSTLMGLQHNSCDLLSTPLTIGTFHILEVEGVTPAG